METKKLNESIFLEETEIEKELSEILQTKGLDKILELTYAYKKYNNEKGEVIYLNESIFEEFIGKKFIKAPTQEELCEIKKEVENKITLLIEKFEEIQSKIRRNLSIEDSKKSIMIGAIEHNINMLKFALNSLIFELEKAGYKHNLSSEEIEKLINKNEEYEKQIYGGKIIENEEEALMCFNYIKTRIETIKTRLPDDKLKRIEGYLKKIETELERRGYDTKKRFDYKIKNDENTKNFLKEYGEILISREEYIEMFNLLFKSLQIRNRAKCSNVGSVYDGPDYLEFPNDERFDKLPLKRILNLMAHEVIGHAVNQHNSEKFFGILRGAGNVEKEEGLAKLLESLAKGENIFTINPISQAFSRILAGEVLQHEEFIDFINIYGNLNNLSSEKIFLRHKRNYPLKGNNVQHKDTTYIRGLIKIISYLKDGGDIIKLFNGKIGLNDIINEKIDFSNKDGFLLPYFIIDLIIYKILYNFSNKKGQLEIKKIDSNTFKEFLKRKYGFLGLDFDNLLNDIPFWQKRFVVKILKIIKSNL